MRGRNSFFRIEGGTVQDGLTMVYSITPENTGVGVSGLPTMTRVWWIVAPSFQIRNRNSGRLTATWRQPRSVGSQRQRSMLAMRSASIGAGAARGRGAVLAAALGGSAAGAPARAARTSA